MMQATVQILKVSLNGSTMRLRLDLRSKPTPLQAFDAVKASIQRCFELTDLQMQGLICKYIDDAGDDCVLNERSVDDWLAAFPEGALRLHAGLQAEGGTSAPARLPGEGGCPSLPDARHDRLIRLAQDHDESTRRSAAGALCAVLSADGDGKLPLAAAAPLASSHPDEHVRRSIADALCGVAAAGDREALESMKMLVLSTDEHVRRRAAEVVCAAAAAASSRGSLHATLEGMLRSSDGQLRGLAAAVLGRAAEVAHGGPPGSLPLKRPRQEAIGSQHIRDLVERVAFLRPAALQGNAEALEELLELSDDRTERVRRDAADALVAASSVGAARAVGTLAVLARHADEHIRRKAVDALAALGEAGDFEEGRAALGQLAWHGDEYVRRCAAGALCSASRHSSGLVAVLERLAGHNDEHIRRLGARALADCVR